MKPFSSVAILLALCFAISLFGCGQSSPSAPSKPENALSKSIPDGGEPEYSGLQVRTLDRVQLDFTIVIPKYLYINSEAPKPLKVMVPGNTPFTFTKSEYIEKKPIFPMRIEFEIPRGVPAGLQKIPLGLHIKYCNKADDICIIKNDIVNVEFMLSNKAGSVSQKHILKKRYDLQ